MNASEIDRIRQLFPCMAHIPDERWASAETIAVHAATAHSVREGAVLHHAMFVLSGWVRVYKLTPGGKEITLYRVRCGECCVLMMAGILGEAEYEASAAVETETELLLLPAAVFRSWMDMYKPLRQFIYKQFVTRLSDVTTLLEQVAFQPVPSRIADYLLSASAAANEDRITITHERLAVELGTAREVVTRCLKRLALEGAVVLERGRIVIASRALLLQALEERL